MTIQSSVRLAVRLSSNANASDSASSLLVSDLVEKDGKRLVRILNPWKRKARLRATGTARDALAAVRGPLDSIGEEDEGWSAELRSALEVVGDERLSDADSLPPIDRDLTLLTSLRLP